MSLSKGRDMKKETGGTIAHFEVFNSSWRNAILFLRREEMKMRLDDT